MRDRPARTRWLEPAIVLLVALAVYAPFLGTKPLDNSEGHRAVPGWTMLRTGDWWHQQVFGLTYLRKPPGMAWAIGASSAVLGENAWGARAPSALCAVLSALTAWAFVTRRMGRPWGLWAGLAQALMPLLWPAGRSAEIEMLDALGAQWMAFGLYGCVKEPIAQAIRVPARPALARLASPLLATLGLTISALAKGPANAPVLLGVLAGAAIAARSWRILLSWRLALALALAAAILVPLALKILAANSAPDAVREDVADKFLWSWSRLPGVLLLAPAALAAALPASLAIPPAISRSIVPEGLDADLDRVRPLARAFAWAWIIGVGVLVLSGVSNPRYALPLAPLLPPVAAWAVMGMVRSAWSPRWRSLARVLTFGGRPALWAGALAMAAWWFIVLTAISPTQDQLAGPAAAVDLGDALRQHEPSPPLRPELWADDAIEARPDVLWRVEREAPGVRVVWAKPAMARAELPPPGAYLLLRVDDDSGERARYARAIDARQLTRVTGAQVRTHRYALYRVPPTTP